MNIKYLKKIGNCQIIETIYKGKTTEVYLGIETSVNPENNQPLYQLVAIKSIPKENIQREKANYLESEIKILKKLNHNNIIQYKNNYLSEHNFYLSFGYCNGGDLQTYCKDYKSKKNHPLEEKYIQKIVRQIASALNYLHSKDILHRDIKLKNILLNFDKYENTLIDGNLPPKLSFEQKLLDEPFTVKITGFDFAKNAANEGLGKTVIGSPLYISPELIDKYNRHDDDKKYDTSIDLWALGVITYEMLTDETPFKGKSYTEVFNNIESGIYYFPKITASKEILEFINGLLQYSPDKRLKINEINSNPFLSRDSNDFSLIDLKKIAKNEEIEMNSRSSNNLKWIFEKWENLKMREENQEVKKEEHLISKEINEAPKETETQSKYDETKKNIQNKELSSRSQTQSTQYESSISKKETSSTQNNINTIEESKEDDSISDNSDEINFRDYQDENGYEVIEDYISKKINKIL